MSRFLGLLFRGACFAAALLMMPDCLAAAAAPSSLPAPLPSPAPVTLQSCLVLGRTGTGGRSPLHTDALEARLVAGTYSPPREGETVSLPDGTTRSWRRLQAGADGWFEAPELDGGYASFRVDSPSARTVLLHAQGDSLVYVNGEIHAGDPYSNGIVRIPVQLHTGTNDLLFQCGRGRLTVDLETPRGPLTLDGADSTLPDLHAGDHGELWGAVLLLNSSTEPVSGLEIEASPGPAVRTVLPTLLPLSIRKVAFRFRARARSGPKTASVSLHLKLLCQGNVLDHLDLSLRMRKPGETYRVTFVSGIDGSVQYYAVNPAHPLPGSNGPRALVLSLHGAGVEAIGQADAYEAKNWCDIVCPTNRRPYGFDWEDWGRLDALEVLDLAKARLHSDPSRIYLAGHSMGGHGVWINGAIYPGLFAAIGPSAGWISFATYGRGRQKAESSPVQEILARSGSGDDTVSLLPNYVNEGIYILHGAADDNVPVTEAREMVKLLTPFHHDFVYHEQPGAGHWWDVSPEPGADCVDWPPMFDLFARHRIPEPGSVRQVEFVTASPGISSTLHWVTIEAQAQQHRTSAVHLQWDPGLGRFSGSTDNVSRMSLDRAIAGVPRPLDVDLDGQTLKQIPWSDGPIYLEREAGQWRVGTGPAPQEKNPVRDGLFKDAFRHDVELVYGSAGSPEENAWALNRARYDAETFWYRGNGSLDVVPDTAFDPERERDRSVVLYGNAETNRAWHALLGDSPVQVTRREVQIGARHFSGADLACLFLRPRPGSAIASVGAVAGTGLPGLRLTERLPYFLSGAGFPDCLLLDSRVLTPSREGPAEASAGGAGDGLLAAGFFGLDWSVDRGEFAWGALNPHLKPPAGG